MEERKFIKLKKEEYGIKEYIKRNLGKGKISKLDIEYTPVGEKIVIHTSKPGLIIGRRGEKIDELTTLLKSKFKLENPHIEIKEIEHPLFDAQLVADEIALNLERMGNLKFKVIAYKKLQEIMKAGALGCELRLSGKLPSDRAKSWRFAEGYLKKSGEPSKEIGRAQATALTKLGISGIKVAIMAPDAKRYDSIVVSQEIWQRIKKDSSSKKQEEVDKPKISKVKASEDKTQKAEDNQESPKENSSKKDSKSSEVKEAPKKVRAKKTVKKTEEEKKE